MCRSSVPNAGFHAFEYESTSGNFPQEELPSQPSGKLGPQSEVSHLHEHLWTLLCQSTCDRSPNRYDLVLIEAGTEDIGAVAAADGDRDDPAEDHERAGEGQRVLNIGRGGEDGQLATPHDGHQAHDEHDGEVDDQGGERQCPEVAAAGARRPATGGL